MNKRIILSLILALTAQLSFATVSDSLKRDLEDYDYLVSFVEENYAPFDAIMQKGYKREYKVLKKQLRKQLCKGEADLERAATDYVLWFYTRFDRHIMLKSETFHMAEANLAQEAIFKSDSTMLTNPGSFEYAPMQSSSLSPFRWCDKGRSPLSHHRPAACATTPAPCPCAAGNRPAKHCSRR